MDAPVLATIGDLVEDVVIWLDGPLTPGTDCPGRVFHDRGGSAANVAAAAAGLTAAPPRFIGCLGEDSLGDRLKAALAASGVDVRLQRRGQTGVVVVLVDPAGERTMIPQRDAATRLEQVDDAWLQGVGLLHVPAYGLVVEPMASSVLGAVARARAAGARISVDASSVGTLTAFGRERAIAMLCELAPDYLLANREEADFLRAGEWAPLAVVKDGPRPTWVRFGGGEGFAVEVSPAGPVRDTTGAGDAFAAGFLAGVLADPADLRAAVEAGHRRAADALTRHGAL